MTEIENLRAELAELRVHTLVTLGVAKACNAYVDAAIARKAFALHHRNNDQYRAAQEECDRAWHGLMKALTIVADERSPKMPQEGFSKC